jgi:hypothetical protein
MDKKSASASTVKESPSRLVGELRVRCEVDSEGMFSHTIFQTFVGNEGAIMDTKVISTDQFYARLQAEVNSKLLLLCSRLLRLSKKGL